MGDGVSQASAPEVETTFGTNAMPIISCRIVRKTGIPFSA
jgi:hypothetical protein